MRASSGGRLTVAWTNQFSRGLREEVVHVERAAPLAAVVGRP